MKVNRRQFIMLGSGAVVAVAAVGYGVWRLTVPSAPTGNPIKIGQLVDLAGGQALYGVWQKRSQEAAMKVLSGAAALAGVSAGIAGRPVELYVVDSATDASTGTKRFRELVSAYEVDFILGPMSSTVGGPCIPIAKELKTPYWFYGETYEFTAKSGNRYAFRHNTDVRQQNAEATAEWAITQFGKKWITLLTDFAYGHSCKEWFRQLATKHGATVLQEVAVPYGSSEVMPYIVKMPWKEADGVFVPMPAATLGPAITQLREVGYKGVVAGPCVDDLLNPEDFPAMEGSIFYGTLPRFLEEYDTPHHRRARELARITPDGRDADDTKNIVSYHHWWMPWETLFVIKKGVEQSGWSSKEDHPKFIKAVEQLGVLKEGPEFFQGEKMYRGEDHQVFMQHHVYQIKNRVPRKIKSIPYTAGVYPAPIDYTKEAF